ncbi:hypothetical protein [Rhizomonospora bruguierae]|uniref:hypothetical protein n=1 Tax=Rhizomonospora bruguierae TaxID=1581705 RepID=UPI001BD01B69|nr:hypothetical protein [Micromonospora sp. NBRC 107566]
MAPPPPPKRNGPLIVGIIAGVLALCLLGTGAVVAGALFISKMDKDGSRTRTAAGSTPAPVQTYRVPPIDEPYSPPNDEPPTEDAPPPPPPPPAKIGQCISVSDKGDFQGIGNCNGTIGTYKVVSVDYSRSSCADRDSAYITVSGYRMCLELHLVRNFCYKFPKNSGWVVAASKCKAKGTVHIIDIVPGASNGNRCTQDYKWNRWYRFTHPTVVYCVMQY